MMVPEGCPAVPIWGSSPAIDPKRGQLYIATGNNYNVPDSVLACVEAAGDDQAAQRACIPADNYMDAMLALDLTTGAVKLGVRGAAVRRGRWCISVIFDINARNCPEPAGPDYDFGQAPALQGEERGANRSSSWAQARSGQYWAVARHRGSSELVTQAGPGGVAGGLQWGVGRGWQTGLHGERQQPGQAVDAPVRRGHERPRGVERIDAATGQLLWQDGAAERRRNVGPVTTANGVVYGCSLDPLGYMYALDASNGEVLWEFASGGSCLSGAAISKGTLFWGSGYSNNFFGTRNDKLYAFSLP